MQRIAIWLKFIGSWNMRKMVNPDNLHLRCLVLIDNDSEDNKRHKLIEFYKNLFGISSYLIEFPYLFLEVSGPKYCSISLAPKQCRDQIIN